MNLKEIHDFAVDLAKEAGSMIKDAYYKEKNVSYKSSYADVLTETDVAVEKLIRDKIAKKFPSHRFIGEESAYEGSGGHELTDRPTWMVDPVDGTCNFVHKVLWMWSTLQSVVGVVYNPILDDMYTAWEGGGAYHNNSPITVSQVKELQRALVISELGSEKDERELEVKVANIGRLIRHCQGMRCLGSAALNMCAVACGAADAYIEYTLHCWDMAGADVIIREAGGQVMDPTGSELDIMSRRVLCGSTRELCQAILPHLDHVTARRDDEK